MPATNTIRKQGENKRKVVRCIQKLIQRGDLRCGDRLPPERDLARQFGVSRPTLRAGLGYLAAFGMIDSRRGAGNFIVDIARIPTLDAHPLHLQAWFQQFSYQEIFEARTEIEIDLAKRAAEFATSNQLMKMSDEIVEMFVCSDSPEEFLKHEVYFCQILGAASGNLKLSALMNAVLSALIENHDRDFYRTLNLKKLADFHRSIYCGIRLKDFKNSSQTTLKPTFNDNRKSADNAGVDKNLLQDRSLYSLLKIRIEEERSDHRLPVSVINPLY